MRSQWITVTRVLAVTITSVVVATFALSAVAEASGPSPSTTKTVSKVQLTCDTAGVQGSTAEDCLRHRALRPAADTRIAGGRDYPLALRISQELRGKTLLGEVQYRSLNPNGAHGKWWTHRSIVWEAADTQAHGSRSMKVCAPQKAGSYEVRSVLAVPADFRRGVMIGKTGSAAPSTSPSPSSSVNPSATPAVSSSALASPSPSATTSSSAAPSASASVIVSAAVPASANPYSATDSIVSSAATPLTVTSTGTGPCPNSGQDKAIVEYFNETNFSMGFNVSLSVSGFVTTLTLVCPVEEDPGYPPAGFDLTMYTSDKSQSASCGSGSITINVPMGSTLAYCDGLMGESNACSVVFVLSNSETGTVYSTSFNDLTGNIGVPGTFSPNLNAATIAYCGPPGGACIASGTCSLPQP